MQHETGVLYGDMEDKNNQLIRQSQEELKVSQVKRTGKLRADSMIDSLGLPSSTNKDLEYLYCGKSCNG